MTNNYRNGAHLNGEPHLHDQYKTLLLKTGIIESKIADLTGLFDKSFSNLDRISISLTKVITHTDIIHKNIDEIKDRIKDLEDYVIDCDHRIKSIEHKTFTLKKDVKLLQEKEADRTLLEQQRIGTVETIKKIPKIFYYIVCAIIGISSSYITYDQFKRDPSTHAEHIK